MARFARAVLAGLTLVALVIGLPILLARYGSWPIHQVPTASQLSDAPGQALTDDAVFAILTVAAWATWAAFTVSVVLELVAAVRGASRPTLPYLAPHPARCPPARGELLDDRHPHRTVRQPAGGRRTGAAAAQRLGAPAGRCGHPRRAPAAGAGSTSRRSIRRRRSRTCPWCGSLGATARGRWPSGISGTGCGGGSCGT